MKRGRAGDGTARNGKRRVQAAKGLAAASRRDSPCRRAITWRGAVLLRLWDPGPCVVDGNALRCSPAF